LIAVQKLTKILLENGYNVSYLSRKLGKTNAIKTYLSRMLKKDK
jgi:hypothetical protein